MFSPSLQTESDQAQLHKRPAEAPHEQDSDELSSARGQLRRRRAYRGRRLAIGAAAAVAVASGAAVAVAVASGAGAVAGHTSQSSTTTSTEAFAVANASGSFQHRIAQLEARGYKDVACAIHGELLFNPQTRRYVTVRA